MELWVKRIRKTFHIHRKRRSGIFKDILCWGQFKKIQLPKEIVSVLDDVNVLAFHHTGTGNLFLTITTGQTKALIYDIQ